MSANSRSETVWKLLHQTRALLLNQGFVDSLPPFLKAGAVEPVSAEGYLDLVARYEHHGAPEAPWPQGQGAGHPQVLILTEHPLTPEALTFVRSWFENPRVNLVLAQDFFVQPLPSLKGDPPPFPSLGRDLCALFQPKAILSLGMIPAQRLLGAPLSLESLRGSEYRFDRWSLITTMNPEEFLPLADEEKARFKAQVWKDLQRLLGKIRYG